MAASGQTLSDQPDKKFIFDGILNEGFNYLIKFFILPLHSLDKHINSILMTPENFLNT